MTAIPAGIGSGAARLCADEEAWLAPSRLMARYHASFKRSFDETYALADSIPHGDLRALRSFLARARGVSRSLEAHHHIEEAGIFPLLRKHPAFRASGAHESAHRAIHAGLERYEAYLDASLREPDSYNAAELRGVMDGFRGVLYDHLDEEVRDLAPESLRAAGITLEEVRRLPF